MSKLYAYKNTKFGVYLYVFFCPACKYDHPFSVKKWQEGGNPIWNFNNDMDKPTFTPSLVVFKNDPVRRCHLSMTDGEIYFHSDSFHHLKGQTVICPDYKQ